MFISMSSKRDLVLVALLAIVLLTMSACQPIAPTDEPGQEAMAPDTEQRRVKGEIYLPGEPSWGGVAINTAFDFTEVDPETHEADGYVNWHVLLPDDDPDTPSWKGVEAAARYVFFGADVEDGDPAAAVVIAQILSKDGFGQGVPGEYSYFWLRDGGEAGQDQFGMRYYSLDPWYEFYPEDEPPVEAGYFSVAEMQLDDAALPLDVELGDIELILPVSIMAAERGQVFEVLPTGEFPQDVTNVQDAIEMAQDGDTVLLKAGTFNFGEWQTNPIPGGFVVIDKGVTVTGEGFDDESNPLTIIQGGGYRQKEHWEHGEWGVVTFGGDGSGGVLQDVWLKEPHFRGIGINGAEGGQNHESFTIRNVKITDISQDIPGWYPKVSVGRSIAMGWNDPAQGIGGPTGTIVVENCDISNLNTTVDLDYVDPETGAAYYTDADGNPLESHTSYGIGMFISTSANFVIRDNTVANQVEGIIAECMSGVGDVTLMDNDITIQPGVLSRNGVRGIRVTPCHPGFVPTPFERTVHVMGNTIDVAGGDEGAVAEGMMLASDSGAEAFAGTMLVSGNEISVDDGYAALVLGSTNPPSTLNQAEIVENLVTGSAEYGMVSTDGAQNCEIADNDMSGFVATVAETGPYGEQTP